MAVAVQSTSTTTWAAASTVVITKPSGLAVGDLMIAHIAVTNQTVTPPAGWDTEIDDVFSGGGDTEREYVFSKIADSTDAAASNFTFTASSSTTIAGAMYRIDGHSAGTGIYITDTDETLDSGTPIISNTVTPLVADSLIILLGFVRATNSGATIGSYAIATSSPSFTEAYDLNSTGGAGSSQQLFGAYGVRPETTGTGNGTIAITGGAATNDTIGAILVIPPSKDFSITDTVTSTDSYVTTLGLFFSEVISTTDIFTSSVERAWTKLARNIKTWTNQNRD